MPTPKQPKPIKITVTSGVKGQPIVVRNRTTGDEMHEILGATAKHTVDLNNLTNSYTAGDVIDIIVTGERVGVNSLAIVGTAPQSVTVATAAITTTLTRGM